MSQPDGRTPDPYRASWLGIATVTAACMTAPVAIVACQRGTDAGLRAAVLWYGLGAAGLGLARLWSLAADRNRTLRHRYDRRRGVAFGGRPPRAAELVDDFAAAPIRIPYPAGGPTSRSRCPDCGMPHDLDPDHPASRWCARVRSPQYQAHCDRTHQGD